MTRIGTLLRHFLGGEGLRAQLVRGSLRGLLVSAVAVLVGFGMQVAIARMLGVNEFGIYAWALAWINFLVMISCCGLDGLAVRRLPPYLMDGDWGKARGFLLFSVIWVSGGALLLGLVLYVIAWFLRERILPGSLDTLIICICVTPLFALGSMRQEFLRAMKHVAKAQILESIVRPLLLLMMLAAMVYLFGLTATSALAMTAQLCASAIVFVIGGWWVLRALPSQARRTAPEHDGRLWLKEALPFLAISGASAFSGQVGMLTLGAVGTAQDTGVYAAVLRITDIAIMGIYSIGAIAAPLIVEVLKKQDRAGLANILKWAARGTFGFSLLALLGILVAGEWILAAFGKKFVEGHDTLYIMLPGILMYAFAGMSGILLAMSGHAGTRAIIGWFSACCNLVICALAAPQFGVYGAALGYTVASFASTLLCLYCCWRYLNVWSGLR